MGGNLGIEELINPARFKPVDASVTDDLVAAPSEVHRIELQRAESLNKRQHRALTGGELARRKEHVALGEEAAGRRLRDAQRRVAWVHLSVTRLRVQWRDFAP